MAAGLVLTVGGLVWLSSPGLALAEVTQGDCAVSVIIDGKTYGPVNDTPDNPIVIPTRTDVVISWAAASATPIHDAEGEVRVEIGPVSFPVERWSSRNGGNQLSDRYRPFTDLRLPFAGIYRVEVTHTGSDGACAGFAYVKVEGSPLATAPGRIAVILTGVSFLLVLIAGIPKKREA